MITWTIDQQQKLAYISLTDRVARGQVETSVDLSDLADAEGVGALHSLVLDFDDEGRLVGIEVAANAERILPLDLLAERGYEPEKYRRDLTENEQ